MFGSGSIARARRGQRDRFPNTHARGDYHSRNDDYHRRNDNPRRGDVSHGRQLQSMGVSRGHVGGSVGASQPRHQRGRTSAPVQLHPLGEQGRSSDMRRSVSHGYLGARAVPSFAQRGDAWARVMSSRMDEPDAGNIRDRSPSKLARARSLAGLREDSYGSAAGRRRDRVPSNNNNQPRGSDDWGHGHGASRGRGRTLRRTRGVAPAELAPIEQPRRRHDGPGRASDFGRRVQPHGSLPRMSKTMARTLTGAGGGDPAMASSLPALRKPARQQQARHSGYGRSVSPLGFHARVVCLLHCFCPCRRAGGAGLGGHVSAHYRKSRRPF